MDRLVELSDEIMKDLGAIPGAIEVDRNLRFSAGEFSFVFDPSLLASSGISASDAAMALRAYIFGTEVTSFLDAENDEVEVRVRAPEESVRYVSAIQALPLLTAAGEIVRVGQVAEVELDTSINAIRRRDGERAITITADKDDSRTPNEITAELQQKLADQELPEGYHVTFGGEQQETVDTFTDLYRSMIISIILIVIIMVVEFNSYVQPLLIFLSIPFALIGVFFGLLLFGGQLNFAAFLGLVSLTGIVVSNGIVLIDRMNQLREEGVPVFEAIRNAGKTRLRPVVLSTLTSVFGVVPLMLVDDAFFQDLSLTLISGQLFSTILTLLFIPVLYLRVAQYLERRRQRRLHAAIAA
jgi:multidrug efflux pump subunit AcrB